MSVISDDVAEADSAPEKDCGQLLFAAVNFCRRAGVDRNWLSLLILRVSQMNLRSLRMEKIKIYLKKTLRRKIVMRLDKF